MGRGVARAAVALGDFTGTGKLEVEEGRERFGNILRQGRGETGGGISTANVHSRSFFRL